MLPDEIRDKILVHIRAQSKLPVEEIADRITSAQDELVSMLVGIDDGVARTQPPAGEWSVQELVRHMILAEVSVAPLITKLGGGTFSADSPLGAAGTMLDDDGKSFPAYLGLLREANVQLASAVRGLTPSFVASATAPHPWLGALNCVEWAASQLVHDADHRQHLGKILAALAQSRA